MPIFQRQLRTPNPDSDERDLDDSFSSSSTLEDMLRSDRDDIPTDTRKDSLEMNDSILTAGQRMLKELPIERRPKSASHLLQSQQAVPRFPHDSKDDSSIERGVRSSGSNTDHPAPLK